MTKKETRKKFGTSCAAIPATRVLARQSSHVFTQKGKDFNLLIINDKEGTITAANVYGNGMAPLGGHLGRRYDASNYRHPLPEKDSPKWKKYEKAGYKKARVSDFSVLREIRVRQTAAK
jgi:hypothetical protein